MLVLPLGYKVHVSEYASVSLQKKQKGISKQLRRSCQPTSIVRRHNVLSLSNSRSCLQVKLRRTTSSKPRLEAIQNKTSNGSLSRVGIYSLVDFWDRRTKEGKKAEFKACKTVVSAVVVSTTRCNEMGDERIYGLRRFRDDGG